MEAKDKAKEKKPARKAGATESAPARTPRKRSETAAAGTQARPDGEPPQNARPPATEAAAPAGFPTRGSEISVTPANGAAPKASRPRISPEERHRLIAEAAYFRATRRGFSGGAEVEDWLAAESEVDTMLMGEE